MRNIEPKRMMQHRERVVKPAADEKEGITEGIKIHKLFEQKGETQVLNIDFCRFNAIQNQVLGYLIPWVTLCGFCRI